MPGDSPSAETPGVSVGRLSDRRHHHRRRRLILGAVLLALFAGDTARFLYKMADPDRMPTLKRWLPYAAELGQDDAPHERHTDYLYPPFFLVVMKPLTWIPPLVAAVVWQWTKYAALALIFVMAWRLAAAVRPLPPWLKVLSVVLSLRFIHSDLSHGNINIYVCLFIVLAAWWIARGRPLAGGLVIGLAACVKLTPALWVVLLAYQRRWRALLGAGLGIVLAIEVVPLLVLSPGQNHTLILQWHEHVVTSFLKDGRISSVGMNQSMAALTNRLLGRTDLIEDEPPIHVVKLDNHTIKWVQRAIGVALLAVLAWVCRPTNPRQRGNDQQAFLLDWALVAPFTLALSGYTWTGHFCSLILGIVLLLAHLSAAAGGAAPRSARWFAVLGFGLFVVTTDLITPAGREWASRWGLPLVGAMLVAAALSVLRERLRRSASETRIQKSQLTIPTPNR